MSEMLERVMRAIEAEGCNEPDEEDYRDMARAAIEAMREPTKAMVTAGNKCTDWAMGADDAWEAMIDEALK